MDVGDERVRLARQESEGRTVAGRSPSSAKVNTGPEGTLKGGDVPDGLARSIAAHRVRPPADEPATREVEVLPVGKGALGQHLSLSSAGLRARPVVLGRSAYGTRDHEQSGRNRDRPPRL